MRRMMISAAAGVVLVTTALGAALWRRAIMPTIDPDDHALVDAGRVDYARHCAACHGANLEGQAHWRERLPNGRLPAPPHSAAGHTWHHPDRQLFEITRNGPSEIVAGYQSDMPAFKAVLSDRAIIAVLAYIKSTWPADIRAAQERVTAADQKSRR